MGSRNRSCSNQRFKVHYHNRTSFRLLAGCFCGIHADYIKNRMDNDKWITVAVLLCAFLVAVPLATLSAMYGILAFAAIAAIGLISIYALKDNSADKNHVPLKKHILIIALVIALITPTVVGAYQTSERCAGYIRPNVERNGMG